MEKQSKNTSGMVLLATEVPGTVLYYLANDEPKTFSYMAYGHDPLDCRRKPSVGFNGQLRTALGLYLLGNGYRTFSPVLMRFHSPDSWSPFGEGEMNAYTYCSGDPINNSDPTGHMNVRKTIEQRKKQFNKQIPGLDYNTINSEFLNSRPEKSTNMPTEARQSEIYELYQNPYTQYSRRQLTIIKKGILNARNITDQQWNTPELITQNWQAIKHSEKMLNLVNKALPHTGNIGLVSAPTFEQATANAITEMKNKQKIYDLKLSSSYEALRSET